MAKLPSPYLGLLTGIYQGYKGAEAEREARTAKEQEWHKEQIAKIGSLNLAEFGPQQQQYLADRLAWHQKQVGMNMQIPTQFDAPPMPYKPENIGGDLLAWGRLAQGVEPEGAADLWSRLPQEVTGGKPAPTIKSVPTGTAELNAQVALAKLDKAMQDGDRTSAQNIINYLRWIQQERMNRGVPPDPQVDDGVQRALQVLETPYGMRTPEQGAPQLPTGQEGLSVSAALKPPQRNISMAGVPAMKTVESERIRQGDESLDIKRQLAESEIRYKDAMMKIGQGRLDLAKEAQQFKEWATKAQIGFTGAGVGLRQAEIIANLLKQLENVRWSEAKGEYGSGLADSMASRIKDQLNQLAGEPTQTGGGSQTNARATQKTPYDASVKEAVNRNLSYEAWRNTASKYVRKDYPGWSQAQRETWMKAKWRANGGK